MYPTITTTTIIPVYSQRDSVFIAPGAADPNNDQSFVPKFISMPIYSIVTWTNGDSIQHTVTSNEEGLFDSGPLSPGDTIDNAFDTPGEFGYHCSIHPWMIGRVMVG
jgi:plastocyanin